jgi:hypothetical protein
MRIEVPRVVRVLWLSGLLLCSGVLSSQGQPINTGIRVVPPVDGATFEPGVPATVVVEPEGPAPLREVIIGTKGVVQRALASPFRFTFSAPEELGSKQLVVVAEDQRRQRFMLELTYHVETTMQVRSIRVTDPPFFIAAERGISVSGIFADGISREITRSREIIYHTSDAQVADVTSDGVINAVDNGTATITVTYKDKSVTVPVTVKFKKLTVPLDIRPGKRKTINLDSAGHVRVAILSTSAFRASSVNPHTVKFGPAGTSPDPDHVRTADVNGDGRPDLVLRFRIHEAGFQCGQPTATLMGRTLIGDQIAGTDTIHVVGRGCGPDRDRDRDDQDSDDPN